MLCYFAVCKTGAVLRSDNFAGGKIVVASRIKVIVLWSLYFRSHCIYIAVAFRSDNL
jgi:hypothetical protein